MIQSQEEVFRLLFHGLNQLEEILGTESVGVKNLTAEVEARAKEPLPVM